MNRAISTVLDVGVAMVLVGASVALLAGVPVPAGGDDVAVHAGGGSAVAGSTMTVEYERADGQQVQVTGTVAGLLHDAALSRQAGVGAPYVTAVETAVADRIQNTGTPTQLVGTCVPADGAAPTESVPAPVVAGPTPPGDEPVDATTYRWNGNQDAATATDDCDPLVVVREWSP